MSKLQSANTNQQHHGRLALALAAGGLVGGCSGSGILTIDPEGYDGLSEETYSLLANPCVITVGATPALSTMTLNLRTGELLYLSLRAADGNVVASARTGSSGECAVPSTYKIDITEQTLFAGTEKVFLDYINGPFALGTTVGSVVTPGITMSLGAASKVVVRGSSGADKITLGTTSAAGNAHSWINVNSDTSPDVRMDGVTDVKVSTGVGADIISADGGNGTGSPLAATITFTAFGGPDADTLTGGLGLSTLDGGDGDDKFVQTLTTGQDIMNGGKGSDTVDYSVRTTPVTVTVCSVGSADPGGSIAGNATCHGLADTALTACIAVLPVNDPVETLCMATPDAAQTGCKAAADLTQTSCNTAAGDAQTTCTTVTCPAAETACEAACAVGAGHAACVTGCQTDTTCTTGCGTTHTSDVGLCTGTHTSGIAACQATRDALCDVLHDAACTAVKTTAYATCDAIAATVLAASGVADNAHCLADDGAAGELDTVNDDIEIVLGGKGNDTISAFGAQCTDGAATNPKLGCTLKGNEGNDVLIGSAQNDTLDGGAGDDVLQGGLGNDTFIGGAGLNTVSYADRAITVKVSLDATKLWVLASSQNGQLGENDVIGADIQNLTGGISDDLLRGNALANIIRGGAGNDTIEGGAGSDALYGDAGDDLLYGGAGIDNLEGGAGADTLVGGDGDDFLDAVDSPAFHDLVIEGDGPNAFGGTNGAAPGTANFATTDALDSSATNCTTL
jgi:Ca2+-binding RTX toxin-like protein